jgi:hypothetical protein
LAAAGSGVGQQGRIWLRGDNNWQTLPLGSINAFIETPDANTFTLDFYAPCPYTITLLAIQLGAGTCTAALKHNGTAISGVTAIAVTTTLQTFSLSTPVAVTDNVTLTITSPASAANLNVSVQVSF